MDNLAAATLPGLPPGSARMHTLAPPPPQALHAPHALPAGPLVTVTIADASCTEPSCYTHRTNESYVLAVSSTAVSIKARTIFGAGWALSSMTPLAQAICRVDCVPVKGAGVGSTAGRQRPNPGPRQARRCLPPSPPAACQEVHTKHNLRPSLPLTSVSTHTHKHAHTHTHTAP